MGLLYRIAETTMDFNTVAGYLALARHGNGLEQADPFRHSGAGLNSIKAYTHIGDAAAYKAEAMLRQYGFIQQMPNPTMSARYALSHTMLDLALPWAVVDEKKLNIQSVVTRLQKASITDGQKLDAFMVMLNCYRTDILMMAEKGGFDPGKAVYRQWETVATPKANNQEWQANPKTDSAWPQFMRQCLGFRMPGKQKELTRAEIDAFWDSWNTLKELGLVYETVVLTHAQGQFICTLRVQDYHADTDRIELSAQTIMVDKPLDCSDRRAQCEAITDGRKWARPQIEQTIPAKPGKQGDPSYMREAGPTVAFYARAGIYNDSEHDLLRVVLPDVITAKDYNLIGIYRPRFRPSTPDVGQWIEKDKVMIKTLMSKLE